MTDRTITRPYVAADGMEMLRRVKSDWPDAETWCREVEGTDRAFSVILDGELVCCAGIIHKTDWIGIAWMTPDTDVNKLRNVDPSIAKDKLFEIRSLFGYKRVEASVREDFPAGHSYMRYLGFKIEGLMVATEMDGSNSYLYARTEW